MSMAVWHYWYADGGPSVYHTIFEELDEDDTLDGEPLDGWIGWRL